MPQPADESDRGEKQSETVFVLFSMHAGRAVLAALQGADHGRSAPEAHRAPRGGGWAGAPGLERCAEYERKPGLPAELLE